eukprot:gb/GECG01015871.1/.p1 GENE.gb/GECG01015871.1/~~gb/GECG01015871.1/.p1  ORF type:complete len:139 (+),score=13.79 gb/GECG01015871.1/:1-417(+)
MYQPEEKFRICSYNVASLRTVASQADHHYGSLGKWLQHIGADIACFQEVKLTDKNLDKSLALADGYETFWALSNTRKGYSGVATFVRDGKYSPIDAKKQMFGRRELSVGRADHPLKEAGCGCQNVQRKRVLTRKAAVF